MHPTLPLQVQLGPSRSAGFVIALAAALVLSLILALPLALLPAAALMGLVIGWLGASFAQVARRRGAGVVAELWLAADLGLTVRLRDGRLVTGKVLPASYVSAGLTTLVWQPDGLRWSRAFAILPDMLPRDDFRRLRVQLRYARSGDSQGRPASQACASISTPLADLACLPSNRR